MHFNMTKPCSNCPFRTDVQPFITLKRVQSLLSDIFENNKTFTCHKTVHYDDMHWNEDDSLYTHEGDEQHCAGALILAEHMKHPNQMMRIAERLGLYDHTKLDMHAPVFQNVEDMLHYFRGE